MNRRQYLAGLGSVAIGSVLAGCSSSETGDDDPAETGNGDDGKTGEGVESDVLPEGIERIEETFHRQLEHELHHGAQLAVYHEGELVVDLAGGVTGPKGGETTPETRHILFSTTKPYTAACIHRLVDRGDLEYDDRLVDHWPAFADGDAGKEEITVRQVLTHQSGLPAIPSIDDEQPIWNDPAEKQRRVEQAELVHPPGAAVQYHLLSFGWIFEGLVREVTGEELDEFAAAEVFEPLGLENTSIGLDKPEDADVATLVGFEPYDQIEDPSEEDAAYNAGVAEAFNSDHVQTSVVGAASGIGTARDLATFYDALLHDGRDVFSDEIVDEWTSVQVEEDHEDGGYSRWGLGVSFGGAPMDSYGITAPPSTYGHGGLGSIMSWADPENDLAFAYVTNGIRDGYEHGERASTMSDTVRHELG